MAARIFCVTLDCHDPVALAGFWEAVIAYEVDLNWAGYGEVVLTDPAGTGPMLLFTTVPEWNEFCVGEPLDARQG